MKKNALTLVTGGLLLLALACYWCLYSVRAGSVVVVKTLGAISTIEKEPGLALKAPWPIQSATRLDTRGRVLEVAGSEVLTRDRFNIIVSVAVGWRLRSEDKSVRAFFKTLQGSLEEAEDKLSGRVRAARKQVINAAALSELVSLEDGQRARFRAVEARMATALQEGLDASGFGLQVDFLYIQSLRFPKDVTGKILERMVKVRERITDRYLAEGRSEAQRIRNEALTERNQKIAEAEGKASGIRGEAEAEVAEAYKVFQRNPKLANWLSKLDTLRAVLDKSTVILSTKDPLKELIEEAPRLEQPKGP